VYANSTTAAFSKYKVLCIKYKGFAAPLILTS